MPLDANINKINFIFNDIFNVLLWNKDMEIRDRNLLFRKLPKMRFFLMT